MTSVAVGVSLWAAAFGNFAAAQTSPREYAKFGDWAVEYLPAGGGAPAICRALRPYGTETWLSIVSGKGILAIDYMGAASHAQGDRYAARFWIDAKPQDGGIASFANRVTDSTGLEWMRIEEGIDEIGTVDLLMNGGQLHIESASNQWDYDLSGSNAPLKSMFKCRDELVLGQGPAGGAQPAPVVQSPSRPNARQADCLMIVRGRSYIDGRCQFESDADGSFRMFGEKYFTYVNIFEPGKADASWNADPASTHAQAPLGDVRRNGACWVNNITQICAWKLGERPRGFATRVAPPPPSPAPMAPAFQRPAPPPPTAARSNCPAPGSIRARPSNQAATIQFANSTNRPLNIFWLDFNGQRKFYRKLNPGQDYRQSTYVGHPWIAVDDRGGCRGSVFWPRPGNNTQEIF